MIGYHVPQTNSPEFYPLQVLETILFTGQSSRLYQRLVDKDQLALSVGGGWGWAFDPTLFEFNIQPRGGVDPAKVEQVLYEEIDRLQKGGITDEELEKAKNIRLAEFYRQMKTISGKSNVIGTYEVFLGDYHKLFTAADEYAKVSKEDVQRVAQQYLIQKHRTVATLIPEAAAPKAPAKE
jgi:zinc protease